MSILACEQTLSCEFIFGNYPTFNWACDIQFELLQRCGMDWPGHKVV